MTLDELIEEAVSIRLAHPEAATWEVVVPFNEAGTEWAGTSNLIAMPGDQEVRLS